MSEDNADKIPELFTIEEVAAKLKISIRTLWRYVDAGMFKSLVVIPRQERRRVLFTMQSIETFITDFSKGLTTETRPKRAYKRTVKKYARKKKATRTRRKAA